MEGQNPKNGAKMPSIMHAKEPKMQFLGSKLVCAYLKNCASYPSGEHNFRKTKDYNWIELKNQGKWRGEQWKKKSNKFEASKN